MINRTKVKESTQIKPGDNGDVLVMKDNAPEWSTPSDAGLAEQANVDSELSKKQDKLVAGDNIHIVGNTISADGKPTPIAIGTVTSGEVPMVSNSGTDTDVVLNFVLPKGDKGDPGKDGTQVNIIAPLTSTSAAKSWSNYDLAIGPGVSSQGSGSGADAPYSIAIGKNISVTSGQKHIGDNLNDAQDNMGIVFGSGRTTYGTPVGIAIGHSQEFTTKGSYAPVIIGDNQEGEKTGDVVSIGRRVGDVGMDSVSIGVDSLVSGKNSVAIGSFARAIEDNVFSVGNGRSFLTVPTRRIVNVTDPTEAQDAATKNYVDTKIAEIPAGTEVNNISPLQVSSPPKNYNGDTNTAIGVGAVSYQGTAIGAYSNAQGNSEAIAIGYQAYASSGVAIGCNAEVNNSGGHDPSSVAIGGYSRADGENGVVSFGSGVSAVALSDDMSEDEIAVAQARAAAVTRRLINVTDPVNAQDAATKNYVDTQLTPINAKLQYVPENTNQILSQIETNAEKAQSAAEAAQSTADGTQADLTALQATVTQLQQTVTQLQTTINSLTLETEEI